MAGGVQCRNLSSLMSRSVEELAVSDQETRSLSLSLASWVKYSNNAAELLPNSDQVKHYGFDHQLVYTNESVNCQIKTC